jgi:CheY-like chemotaxis protein
MQIMLIDDDPGVRGLAKTLLSALGHEVLDFARPEDAVESLPRNRVDLVLSDLQMPGMNGFNVAQKVAEIIGTTPPRVLLLSGSDSLDVELETFPPSVIIGVLPKPFQKNELGNVISLIERTRTCCPGTLAPFCLYHQEHCSAAARREPQFPCDSSDYSGCSHYNEHCGMMLRLWIATQNFVSP